MHHRMIVPTSSGAFYAHPVEHMFGVIGSVVVTLIVCNFVLLPVSYVTFVMFGILASFFSVNGHTPGTKHSIHHRRVSVNYSNTPHLLDTVLGTYVDN